MSRIAQQPLRPADWLRSQRVRAQGFAVWFPLTVFLLTRAVNAVMFGLVFGRQIAILVAGLGSRLAIASAASPDH